MKWKRNARITARTRVENFIYIESIIQHSRECAFTILNRHKSNFQWICDFIGNTNSIVDHLTLIDGGFLEKNERTYDLGRDTIKITFTKYDECCSNVGVILVYSRFNTVSLIFVLTKDWAVIFNRRDHQRVPSKH